MQSAVLSDKFRNEISWNGYGSDIMKSGLQKYIRRGMTEKALYCAGELDLFKEATNRGEVIRTNFLHRLMVIYLEDVENLAIFDAIDRLMRLILLERGKPNRSKENEEMLISEVVHHLSLSTKARVCSHIRAVFNPKYQVEELTSVYPSLQPLWKEIETNRIGSSTASLTFNCTMFKKYLKEKHILSVYYAFQIDQSEEKLPEKCFKSTKPVWFIFQELCTPFNLVFIQKFMDWYKDHIGGMKEGFMCWLVPLLTELSVLLRADSIELKEEKYDGWDANRNGMHIDIDDFVVDRHTRRGHKKSLVEFASNGAFVENEATWVNPLWKKFYEDGKRWEEKQTIVGEIRLPKKKKVRPTLVTPVSVVSEIAEYSFIVRTQLTTSNSKMDVYFAKDRDEKLVVVKGPYKNRMEIDILERNTSWKIKNGIPYLPFEVRQMIPDRWKEGTPLGARNKIDRTQPAWFIVFDSVIKEEQLHKKFHSSKLWTETEIVDWEKIPLHFDYKTNMYSDQEIVDYVHALLFRYIRGISDLADRNFLCFNQHIISIDEDIENHHLNLYGELRKNKAKYIYDWLDQKYHLLSVKKWKGTTDKELECLKQIQTKENCLNLFQFN